MRCKQFVANCGGLLLSAVMCVTTSCALASEEEEPKVNIWNWSDYIAQDTVKNFQKATNIETNYVMFDSNELVEARLLSGITGFDALMMTSYYVPRLAKADALIPLDKSLLKNYGNLDPKRMELLGTLDKDNAYAIPYTEISLGIGYNTKKIKEIFGEDYKVDSWDFLFKKENSAKLKQCGIAVLDSPIEIISAVQHYLGNNPASEKREDYDVARKLLTDLAQNVAYFHSSRYINDLASGDVCVAIGYSGDILQANDRAKAANRDYEIKYTIPKEGSLMWYDCWVLAKGAPHYKNAHKWIDYILDPDTAKEISNETRYILPVTQAIEQLDPSLVSNPSVNLSKEVLKKVYFPTVPSSKQTKIQNEVWNYMKLNSNVQKVEEEESDWL